MKIAPNHRPPLLIGYGNASRRDDGLGPALAARIGWLRRFLVTVETCQQLGLDYAATMAEYAFVILADAAAEGPEPFAFSRLRASPGAAPLGSHDIKPESLLYLTERLFNARPRAYLLGIRGYSFGEFGETLSRRAKKNLTAAAAFAGNLLLSYTFRNEGAPKSCIPFKRSTDKTIGRCPLSRRVWYPES